MQLKGLAKVSTVAKTFNDIVNSGTVSNLAFKTALEGISNQEKINIVSQSALNETQKIGALASAGLTAEELKQTVQTGALSASQATTTTTTLGLGTAFKGLGIKIKEATANMLAFMAANPITMLVVGIAAVSTATYAAIKASDAWFNRTKKHATESTEAYNDIKSQIDELNAELQTNADRIDELNAKEHLTLIESEELQKLKESNRELENQIALKQKLAETELREAREETLKYFDEGGGWVGNKETHDIEWADRIDYAKYQLEELKKVQEKITEVEKEIAIIDTSTNQGKFLYKQKTTELDTLQKDYDIFLEKVQDFNDTVSTLDDNLIEGKDDEIINRLQEFYNLLNETLTGVAQTHTDTIAATLAKADFQSASKQLEELGQSGELSVDTLSSSFPELIEYLDKAGVSAEELYQHIMALSNPDALNYDEVENQFKNSLGLLRDGAIKRGSDMQIWNEVKNAFSDDEWELALQAYLKIKDQYGDHPEGWNAKDWISNIQSELDNSELKISAAPLSITETVNQISTQLKPAFDSLKSAYQDIFSLDENTGEQLFSLEDVGIETFESIRAELEKLDGIDGINVDYSAFENFVSVLNDTSSTADEVQTQFDNLATSIIYTTDCTNMSVETYDLLVQSLTEMGVTNAEEVLNNLKDIQEELVRAGYNLADITLEEAVRLIELGHELTIFIIPF